jgi:hypothetical protein
LPERVTGLNEFDVFHNPSLLVDSDAAGTSAVWVRAWRRLVERGLRFDPEQRPASVLDFAAEIDKLAVEHPLSGVLSFEPSGSLSAARLVDGTDAFARVITDWPSSGARAPSGTIMPFEYPIPPFPWSAGWTYPPG